MKYEYLDNFLQKRNGVILSSDLKALDISRPYFSEYAEKRNLERVARGVYLSPDAVGDPFFILQARWPKAIISHEAALYLWGLAEREPMPITVTVNSGYNASNLTAAGIKVYKIKEELLDLGKAETSTPGGHTVTLYSPERSLCDLFRSRSQVEAQELHGAVKEYLRGKEKNIPLLLRYAKALRVERVMKPYLEALLA